jgi:hypothetical protein
LIKKGGVRGIKTEGFEILTHYHPPIPLPSKTVSQFVMPAEAGIQLVVDLNIFKDLDSRFRGNDQLDPYEYLCNV